MSFLSVAALQSAQAQFTLQLLHASDLEGGVEAIGTAPNFAAIVDTLEGEYPNSTVVLSSGDNWITGPFYSAANQSSLRDTLNAVYNTLYNTTMFNNLREAGGRVDISIMNVIGFDAACFGNHEFDAGTDAIEDIIGPDIRNSGTDARWIGAQFPYLSANLDFSTSNLNGLVEPSLVNSTAFSPSPLDWVAVDTAKKISKATIINRGAQQIGVVGATTQRLASISSPGNVSVIGATNDNMTQLASILQPEINALDAAGVDIIIVVSHLQNFSLEQQLAGLLNHVDIIVAGGSDFLLADGSDVLNSGDVAAGPYPFSTLNADSDSCLIVSTDGKYSYVGRLVVDFDANGNILPSTVDTLESGAYATQTSVVNTLWGSDNPFAAGSKGRLVQRLTNAVSTIVTAKDGNTFGYSDVYIDGRRTTVRSQEANMGNLTADANLWVAQQYNSNVVASIKNGGGIRAEIGEVVETSPGVFQFLRPQANALSGKLEGEISQLDIENTLKFNNGLVILDLKPAGLKDIIEHGIGNYAPGTTEGRFPQVGGLRFSFDPSLAAGSRIQNMAIVNNSGAVVDTVVLNGTVYGDPNRDLKIVTLNFIAGGGDGYPFPTLATGQVDLDTALTAAGNATFAAPGGEQDALAEYLAAEHPTTMTAYADAEVDQTQDERIQILSLRNDVVFSGTISVTALQQATGQVSLFPNPTTQQFTISSETATIERLEFYTLAGQMVRLELVQDQQATIAVSQMETAIYVVRVYTDAGVETMKLIKQ